MQITITGMPGSGKSTVAKILARKLHYKRYSAGEIRRRIARKKGILLRELNKIGEKEQWTDKIADEFIKKLARKDKIIVDGRIAWYFLPDSIKFFLDADIKTRAKRVLESKRKEEQFNDLREAMKEIREREKSDMKRYKKYYGIKNCYDKRHFDYIIDTTHSNPRNVANKMIKIIKGLEKNIRK